MLNLPYSGMSAQQEKKAIEIGSFTANVMGFKVI